MIKKAFINILAICFIGILLVPITGTAHRSGGDNPPEKVHRVIEVLFRLDSREVHDKVAHDFNNYGARPHRDPTRRDGYEGGHAGYDVAHIDDDAPFYSLTDGVVIKVKHPNPSNIKELSYISIYNVTHNKTVLYLHPSAINIAEGQTVEVGTPLGRQGNTGNSTNPHVHFEVRLNRSEVASWGITASKRTNRPNENPIPFLYDQANALVIRSPGYDKPDLVIESINAEPAILGPGAKFKLYATLKNQGDAASKATTLRYYDSDDDKISQNDRQLGGGHRGPLAPDDTIRKYLTVTVPRTPGTYYYGVCVDPVPNERDTGNNCSKAIKVIVRLQNVDEDVNNDGIVDVQDLVQVAQRYGQEGNNAADVNEDGVVDVKDLMLVAKAIGDAAGAPAVRSQMQALFTAEQLQELLTGAKALENSSLSDQRGLALLEQLFRLSTPKKTALLPNYPNPFNPETWIPYQLAESAKVTLTIYAADGRLIRTVALGSRAAGTYHSKSRAVYWDGRNAQGEPVASGVYFYTFTAGDFTATRKMLIRK